MHHTLRISDKPPNRTKSCQNVCLTCWGVHPANLSTHKRYAIASQIQRADLLLMTTRAKRRVHNAHTVSLVRYTRIIDRNVMTESFVHTGPVPFSSLFRGKGPPKQLSWKEGPSQAQSRLQFCVRQPVAVVCPGCDGPKGGSGEIGPDPRPFGPSQPGADKAWTRLPHTKPACT